MGTNEHYLTDDYGYTCMELRVLPLNGDGNILVSRQGLERELKHRIEINAKLADSCKWKLPAWEDLRVYATLNEER